MLFIGLRHWLSGNLLNYDVVECVRGSFGPDCEWTCDSCQNGASCYHDNPGCLCAPGWQGFLCNQTCPLVPWLHILYLLYGHLYNLVFGYNSVPLLSYFGCNFVYEKYDSIFMALQHLIQLMTEAGFCLWSKWFNCTCINMSESDG